jgi:N-acetylmuramoyl-L-alanine amidase
MAQRRQILVNHFKPSALAALAVLFLALPLSAFGQAPPAPGAHFTVVLDAAHGGDDAGATLPLNPAQAPPPTQQEKQFTLAFTQRLRAILQARGMVVVTTRDTDAAIDADHRAETANRARPQACLSLHASAVGSGVHLYISSLAPTSPERMMPWKTAQAAFVTRSLALAGTLNSALTHASVPVTLGRTALPGIDSMACPTVAVEIAPVLTSSHNQQQALGDANYQTQVANAVVAALLVWRSEAPQP